MTLMFLFGSIATQKLAPQSVCGSPATYAEQLKISSRPANHDLKAQRDKLMKTFGAHPVGRNLTPEPRFLEIMKGSPNSRLSDDQILYLGCYVRAHFRTIESQYLYVITERLTRTSLTPDVTVLSVVPYLNTHIFKSRPDVIRAIAERFPDDKQLLDTSIYLKGLFFESLAPPERRQEILREIRACEAKNGSSIYTRIGGLMQEMELAVDQHDPDAFKVAESKYFPLMRGSELTDWEYMMLWGGHIHGRHILFGEPNGKLTGWDWGKKRYTNGRPKP